MSFSSVVKQTQQQKQLSNNAHIHTCIETLNVRNGWARTHTCKAYPPRLFGMNNAIVRANNRRLTGSHVFTFRCCMILVSSVCLVVYSPLEHTTHRTRVLGHFGSRTLYDSNLSTRLLLGSLPPLLKRVSLSCVI